MTTIAASLLTFYLTLEFYGVIALCLYENTSGIGLMVLGVLLFFGGKLALAESWSVRHAPTCGSIVSS